MSFDIAKVPGGDVSAFGARCRGEALAAAASGDWRPIYHWSKNWIGSGGGAWIPDPWLLYAVSALLQKKPKIATHSLDLAAANWLGGEQDRALIAFCRGQIVRLNLRDPKTALADLSTARETGPAWLMPSVVEAIAECQEEAAASRKRVSSVERLPGFLPRAGIAETVAPDVSDRRDGDMPGVWSAVQGHFAS